MGLWATFKNALGLTPPLTVKQPGPFVATEAAIEAAAALSEGVVLHVQTVPNSVGHVVTTVVGPDEPGLEALSEKIRVAASDLPTLQGMVLDHAEGRFRAQTHLELRARETPNPDGRLYMASRPLNRGGPRFFQQPEGAPPLVAALLAHPGVKSALFRANTVTVVREAAEPWDGIDAHVDVTLRQYLLHCGKALAPRARSEAENSELEQRVLAILEERVRPRVHQDGGDIELLEVVDGIVRVHMVGACSGCPASGLTLKFGIEQTLKELLPGEIEAVEQVG
jgi:Fe-S cluster biogenesis protein NfuA